MPIPKLFTPQQVAEREKEKMALQSLSKTINFLIGAFFKPSALEKISGPKIHFAGYTGKVALFYEKLRNILDYKEEHLIRTYAISRILKRRILIERQSPNFANSFIEELIRGGYLRNDAIPEKLIEPINKRLGIYTKLLKQINNLKIKKINPYEFKDWLLLILAYEIDEYLVPFFQSQAIFDSANELVKKTQPFREWPLSFRDQEIQIFIATYRALLKADDNFISYKLLLFNYPEWQTFDFEKISALISTLVDFYVKAKIQLHHPANNRLTEKLKGAAVSFQVIRDIILENKEQAEVIFRNPDILGGKVNEIVNSYYRKTWGKFIKIATRSIFYIFLTKMLLAILIEMPIDKFFYGIVDYFHIGINILFPPLFLFLIVLTIRIPSKKNTLKIIEDVKRVVYQDIVFLDRLKPSVKPSKVVYGIFTFIYALIYLLSFTGIVWLLYRLKFNMISGTLALLFLCIISFFGIRIRHQAKEFFVLEGKEGLIVFLGAILFLPVIKAGHFISTHFQKVNVFLYIFDLFLEAPFKYFLEFFDKFTSFLKEKREEVT